MLKKDRYAAPAGAALVAVMILSACGGAPAATSTAAPASESPAPASSASVQPPPVAPPPSVPPAGVAFSEAESFGVEGSLTQVVDVAYWNDTFVAVSVTEEVMSSDRQVHIWSSEDGRSWTSRETSLAPAPAAVSQLLVLGEGRLALIGATLDAGLSDWTAEAWVTHDLAEWEQVDLGLPDEEPFRVAHGPAGYVASAAGAIWFSRDGLNWERAHGDVNAVGDIRAGSEGFVGTTHTPAGAQSVASGDGLEWFGGEVLRGRSAGVGAVGGDWVAVAGEDEFGLWSSADGLDWEPTTTIRDLSGFSSGVGIDTQVTHVPLVGVGDEVYMTLAWNHCCAQLSGGRGVLRSSDGIEWEELDFGDAVVQAAASDGQRIVLAGFRGRGAEAVIWASDN